jgi:hypothetical protein
LSHGENGFDADFEHERRSTGVFSKPPVVRETTRVPMNDWRTPSSAMTSFAVAKQRRSGENIKGKESDEAAINRLNF